MQRVPRTAVTCGSRLLPISILLLLNWISQRKSLIQLAARTQTTTPSTSSFKLAAWGFLIPEDRDHLVTLLYNGLMPET